MYDEFAKGGLAKTSRGSEQPLSQFVTLDKSKKKKPKTKPDKQKE